MSNQFGDTRIDDDLTLLSETLEEVLRSSGDPADQKYVELKARAEKALDDVKKLADMKLYGAILGKALYTGNIDLAAAVARTKEGNE